MGNSRYPGPAVQQELTCLLKTALAYDLEKDFVQVPAIGGPWAATADLLGVDAAELQRPSPNGFVGHVDAPFGKQVLDIAIAQCEPEIEPDGMLDDCGWKPVTGVRNRVHVG